MTNEELILVTPQQAFQKVQNKEWDLKEFVRWATVNQDVSYDNGREDGYGSGYDSGYTAGRCDFGG